MLAYIESEQVDVLIIHKIDRLARNRMDDLMITVALEKAGVQLVSCSEQIDNKTPAGKLTHGLMALIAEWYSSNLSSEVKTKTLQKVRNGGTTGKAPVGYLNVRQKVAGREIRTVEVDPDRVEHVRWAFRSYASGDYTVRQLTTALEARGLTTVATKQYPETALSISKVHRMLRNRFYIGYFTWGGVEYESNQTPIIERPLFENVQEMLTARNVSGEKQRLHNHYLKGTVRCGGCQSRLCVTHATNRWGTTYVYFFCLGRQQRRTTCLRKAVSIDVIEEKIEQLWDQVRISPEYAALLDELIRDELAVYRDQAERTRTSAEHRLKLLQGQRRSLLDAHYAGAIPLELLKAEQDRLTEAVAACQRRLEKAGTTSAALEANLEQCLQFIQDVAATYRAAPARVRRRMNQALFEQILIEEDGTVVGQLAGPHRQLLDPGLVIPASKDPAKPEPELETEDDPIEPQQEVLFDPSAWSLGVPAWMYGLAASADEKAPDIRCQGLLTRPGPESFFGLGFEKGTCGAPSGTAFQPWIGLTLCR